MFNAPGKSCGTLGDNGESFVCCGETDQRHRFLAETEFTLKGQPKERDRAGIAYLQNDSELSAARNMEK